MTTALGLYVLPVERVMFTLTWLLQTVLCVALLAAIIVNFVLRFTSPDV